MIRRGIDTSRARSAAPQGPRLKVRKGGQGEPLEVMPALGVSLPQGVEIAAGLSAGDEVMRP